MKNTANMTSLFYIKYKYFEFNSRQLSPKASLNTEQLVNPESFINIGNKNLWWD